jgi:signal transduction histidine kinase
MAPLQQSENNPILGSLKLSVSRPSFLGLLVAVMASILILLAFLQVRWSQQASEAERQLLRVGLHASIHRFNRDLSSQLMSLCRAFQTPAAASPKLALDDLADHYGDWRRISRRPDLLKSVGVWDAEQSRYLHLNPATRRFEQAPLPRRVQPLAEFGGKPRAVSRVAGADSAGGSLWEFDEKGLVFLRRIELLPASRADGRRIKPSGLFLVLELSHYYLSSVMLPEFVRRYFSGPGGLIYRVEIRQGGSENGNLYASESDVPVNIFATADAVVTLLNDLPASAAATGKAEAKSEEENVRNPGGAESAFDAEFFAAGWQPVIVPFRPSQEWEMAVKHRAGSLDQAVRELQRRNLAVGLGVLALLAASLGLILVSVRRAHRLAQLQMDFAAGISHELRTPLAIICSAADNLAEGVIISGPQVKHYGALIRDEGGRLTSLVDQILAFVAEESGRVRYDFQPLEIEGFVEQVLADSRTVIESSHLRLEKHISPDLPLVRADAVALSQCVQNLISNVAKYGSEGGWIGVQAESRMTTRGEEIQLTVEDRGQGIAPADLPHIFEPFYRGQAAAANQTHGTGIGLSLAKDIATAMGGTLTVRSEPGKGAAFTLHIPAMERDKDESALSRPA